MGSGDHDGNNFGYVDLDKSYANLVQYYQAVPAIHVIRGDGVASLNTYPDDTFDMVYIDADHSYEGCKRDLEAASKKVKVGGYIMGHDYEMNMAKAQNVYHFGVKQAVDEFCLARGLRICAKGLDGCVSYAICREA
jgi:predicted O-methyltransferase YrrM